MLKRTPLKRKSTQQISRRGEQQLQKEKDRSFFLEIWREREHKCQSCGRGLGKEPLTVYFDHLLEKETYPELRCIKENIFLVCFDCHGNKNMGHPIEAHKKAIEEAKIKFGI